MGWGSVTGMHTPGALLGSVRDDASRRHVAAPRSRPTHDGRRPPLPPQGTESRPPSIDTAYTVRDYGPPFIEHNDGDHVVIVRRTNLPTSGQVPPSIYPQPYPIRLVPPTWDAGLSFNPGGF